jgi:hypothetical protein
MKQGLLVAGIILAWFAAEYGLVRVVLGFVWWVVWR